MDKESIRALASDFLHTSEFNTVSGDLALSKDLAGLKIFDEPLIAYGSALDPMFQALKAPEAIGDHFRLPGEWLPEAKTVISFFFPFTEKVRKSNRTDPAWPSNEWLHGRIEGQRFIAEFTQFLKEKLTDSGNLAAAPSLDQRFWSLSAKNEDYSFTSNWSERHVGFVCGLGTFGLSKGIITEKGMAGRLGSIVTELWLTPDVRPYTGLYENCSMCGVCISHCPVQAISRAEGKKHQPCSDYLNSILEVHKPRYGCGKCQVGVPCENRIPPKEAVRL